MIGFVRDRIPKPTDFRKVDPAGNPAPGTHSSTSLPVCCAFRSRRRWPDFSTFPSARRFRSWIGPVPGTRLGGGRILPGRAPGKVNRVGRAPPMVAMTASGNAAPRRPAPRAPRPQVRARNRWIGREPEQWFRHWIRARTTPDPRPRETQRAAEFHPTLSRGDDSPDPQ